MTKTTRERSENAAAAGTTSGVAPGRSSLSRTTYGPIVQRKASDALADDSIDQRSDILETRATVSGSSEAPQRENAGHMDAALRGNDVLADGSIDQRGELIETRATVSGAAEGPLSGRKLRSACRTNPHYARSLGWTADLFGGSGDARSEECAQAIAKFQADAGLMVDGIAGPKTTARARARGGGERTPELGEELAGGAGGVNAAYGDLE